MFIIIKQEWKATEVTIKPDLERGSLHPREALCQIHFIHSKAVANILNEAEIYFYWGD